MSLDNMKRLEIPYYEIIQKEDEIHDYQAKKY